MSIPEVKVVYKDGFDPRVRGSVPSGSPTGRGSAIPAAVKIHTRKRAPGNNLFYKNKQQNHA